MKHTKTCEQCGKSFTHPTLMQAATALSLHITRKHGRPNLKPNPKLYSIEEDKPKRKYTRRKPEIGARFCPNCGCDMAAVSLALSTIQGMKT